MKYLIYLSIALIFTLSACAFDTIEDVDPNIQPPVTCDTTANVSYSVQIYPIIQQKCQLCHSFDHPKGLDYRSFNIVQTAALSGEMVKALRHTSDFPMPRRVINSPEADQLDECTIQLFEKWVALGAPNN